MIIRKKIRIKGRESDVDGGIWRPKLRRNHHRVIPTISYTKMYVCDGLLRVNSKGLLCKIPYQEYQFVSKGRFKDARVD